MKNKPVLNDSAILKQNTTNTSNSKSAEKYLDILKNIEDGYFEVDLAGNFTFFNDSVCRIIGYSRKELMGMNNRQYTDKENLNKVFQAYNKVYKTGKSLKEFGWYITKKDGSKRYIEGSVILLKNSSGKPTGFRGIARDITERKQMEKKLRNSEEKFRMLAESSAFAIMMHQGDRFIYANRAAEEISGYTEEELFSMNFWDLVHPDHRDMVKQSGYNRQQGKVLPRAYEFKIITKNGVEKWVSLSGNPIQYEDKPTALISVTDITERKIAEAALKESEQKYRELSIIDDLTQLYNSRHFYAQLEREIERSNRYGHPLTLLLLDLDKFKDFNDTYGHVQGDYVLSRLGHAIQRSLREIDSAYRYGGEEFTIILPMTVSKEGIVTAKRIQKELKKENFSLVLGQEVYMTVSIGLAQYKHKEEIKAFVRRVDQFMYKVKKTGRGTICSDDGDV
jgi:diguanylate cyclase (GGDEF)-like protein/PAS domain S-box-containing protein